MWSLLTFGKNKQFLKIFIKKQSVHINSIIFVKNNSIFQNKMKTRIVNLYIFVHFFIV